MIYLKKNHVQPFEDANQNTLIEKIDLTVRDTEEQNAAIPKKNINPAVSSIIDLVPQRDYNKRQMSKYIESLDSNSEEKRK
ncbi:hypothetical protein GUI12_01680 [Anaplasmataceae bacterium AB001_6]|nr:hypothetical protein GUI12_01680 [Anaplasmataceae bacterium AB001_6]